MFTLRFKNYYLLTLATKQTHLEICRLEHIELMYDLCVLELFEIFSLAK